MIFLAAQTLFLAGGWALLPIFRLNRVMAYLVVAAWAAVGTSLWGSPSLLCWVLATGALAVMQLNHLASDRPSGAVARDREAGADGQKAIDP